MSKVSIYENSWLDLVFEGKNKAYGAYQLRQQSDRTTVIAFFLGLLFVVSASAILLNIFSGKPAAISIPNIEDYVITISPYHPPTQNQQKQVIPATKKTDTNEEKQLVNPEIVKSEQADQNIAKVTDNTPQNTVSEGSGTTTALPTSAAGTGTEIPTSVDSGTTVNTTLALDKLPEFPGGIEKFYGYVGKNFNNPESDEPKTLRVYVSFVIEKDGSMTDIQVKRDPGFGLGKEAVRVLRSLKTKWSPGMIAGKPVRTAYNLPITVQVQ